MHPSTEPVKPDFDFERRQLQNNAYAEHVRAWRRSLFPKSYDKHGRFICLPDLGDSP